jgi:glycosyltransferase involved in cell wall biosynthesis
LAKVLHVTECYFGGVSRAIRTLISLNPQHEHFILYDGLDDTFPHDVVSVRKFSASNFFLRSVEVGSWARHLQPDFVHLHSSWAGAYGRIFRTNAKIIYQPHCYKFDDAGLGFAKRLTYRLAEKLLSFRTDVTVALSPHEERMARSLNRNVACVYVPNAPSCDVRHGDLLEDFNAQRPKVVMVGRICPQKDPAYFAAVATRVGQKFLSSRPVFRWIGDGDEDLRSSLEAAGIEVSGWKQGEDLVAELDSADLYIHSAKYEGFPLSILDAAARGLPVIARRIDALEGSAAFQVSTPEEVVQTMQRCVEDPNFRRSLLERSRQILLVMNEEEQRVAWSEVYSEGVSESCKS